MIIPSIVHAVSNNSNGHIKNAAKISENFKELLLKGSNLRDPLK